MLDKNCILPSGTHSSKEEDEIIRLVYPEGGSGAVLLLIPNRSRASVAARACYLKIRFSGIRKIQKPFFLKEA